MPEFSTINFNYTPAYFYLLAWTFQVMGLSPESTGVLHLILRFLASGVFFLVARRAGCSTPVSGVLAMIWATFAHGPVGRPDDLGVLFLITSVALLLDQKQPGYAFALAGICLGLAFLTHPMTLMIGLPLAFALTILFAIRSDGNLKRRGLILLGATIPTSALWLFWIVPYWSEFRTLFFGLAVPMVASPSYLNSLVTFGKHLVYGTWARPPYALYRSLIPLQYSLIPVVVLLIYLVLLSMKERTTLFETSLILSPLVIFPLLAARSVMHGMYMAWFSMGAITLIPIVARSSFSKPSYLNLMERVFIVVLVSTIALQLSAHFLLQGLFVAGDLAMRTTCGRAPPSQPWPYFQQAIKF